ncbi:hypothetical protein DFH08DRAFT_804643 [Mycena albidolilacea]|uniref:Uncharacterized protein n=1 Tax=Mycena albidolilacea TaxID=1033008 RepID=A0AAD7AAR2_9AGAR|nr:hypothetical protein DFH08DRAFT_804643 [Mycena albidolilacea]
MSRGEAAVHRPCISLARRIDEGTQKGQNECTRLRKEDTRNLIRILPQTRKVDPTKHEIIANANEKRPKTHHSAHNTNNLSASSRDTLRAQRRGEVIVERAEREVEREEGKRAVVVDLHMSGRSEESRRGAKKAEIKTTPKQRSRGEALGRWHEKYEKIAIEREKGKRERSVEREKRMEVRRSLLSIKSTIAEEKGAKNRPSATHTPTHILPHRPPVGAAVPGTEGLQMNSTPVDPRVDLTPVRVAAEGEGERGLKVGGGVGASEQRVEKKEWPEPKSPRHFRGQVHVAAAAARREKPSVEPPDITPQGPPPAQGESMHVAPAVENKTATEFHPASIFPSYGFSARRSDWLRMDTGTPAGTFGLTRTRTRKNRTRVRVGSKTRTGYPRVLNTPAGPQTRGVYPQNFRNK